MVATAASFGASSFRYQEMSNGYCLLLCREPH